MICSKHVSIKCPKGVQRVSNKCADNIRKVFKVYNQSPISVQQVGKTVLPSLPQASNKCPTIPQHVSTKCPKSIPDVFKKCRSKWQHISLYWPYAGLYWHWDGLMLALCWPHVNSWCCPYVNLRSTLDWRYVYLNVNLRLISSWPYVDLLSTLYTYPMLTIYLPCVDLPLALCWCKFDLMLMLCWPYVYLHADLISALCLPHI